MRCGGHERERGETVLGLSCTILCNLPFIVSQETNAMLKEVPKILVLATNLCNMCSFLVLTCQHLTALNIVLRSKTYNFVVRVPIPLLPSQLPTYQDVVKCV